MIIEMISKAIFLDILGVYLFCLYLSNGKQDRQVQTRKIYSNKMDLFLDALAYLALFVPLVYIFTPWLEFANYRLPLWFSLAGVLLFIIALLLIGKARSMIGHNILSRMEIREKQTLVSEGLYQFIRHPVYAGFWLCCIAQPLLLHNWIAGFAILATFVPFYCVQVPREEQMLLGHFGEAYRKDMDRTGRIFPRITLRLLRDGGVKRQNTMSFAKVNNGNPK
jgi:protein-S-isoprenylcysteine O-methyltransferase Ste14